MVARARRRLPRERGAAVASMASTRCRVAATPSTRPAREPVVAATPRAAPSRCHTTGNAFRKISALAAPVAIPKQQGLTRQQALGRLGGKCAGSIGENKFAVEVAADGRSRCQLRTCKEPLKIGELRCDLGVPRRCLHSNTTRVHQTRSWLVSLSNLSEFGPNRDAPRRPTTTTCWRDAQN